MRTRSQIYALKVYDQVRGMADREEDFRKKYGSMAHRLPALIRSSGLAQALGFLETRATREKAHAMLLQHIEEAVGESSLVCRSRKADLCEYMSLTRKVMLALEWYGRFAESVLGVKKDSNVEG
ncbi:MAG TPA: type III-B CRISPR module-associated protein Cmr5 [Firmicutes bacterium]|nr:type III-B CRISPR module-associated protein Cmr5 [Bacillota bacterium]